MPGTTAKLTSLSHLGLAVEVALGTPILPTAWMPIMKFTPQDDLVYVPDQGMRGQPAKTFGNYLGVESSSYQVDGMVYPLSFGNILAAFFGLDTVSGVAPYVHTFSTLGTGLPSFTISDYYVAQARQWAGSRCDSLQIKFTPEAGLQFTAKYIGFLSVTYVVEATTTFEVEPFFLGWQAALMLGGSSNNKLISYTLNLTREKSAAVFAANNSQTPYDIFMGDVVGEYSLEFVMNDDTEYALALAQGVKACSVTFTQDATHILKLTSTSIQFTKPTIDRSGPYVVCTIDGEANWNSTDGGVAAAVLTNSTVAAYSTTAAS